MKKLLYAVALSSFFSTPIALAENPNHLDYGVTRYESSNPGNLYQVKLGAGIAQSGKQNASMPLVSFGKRYEVGDAAIEISTSWGTHKSDSGFKTLFYNLPKITYIAFLNPNSSTSFYYGAGFSWGSIEQKAPKYLPIEKSYFTGIFAEGTAGYELHRTTAIRTMVELSLSQPLVANSKRGPHPGPTGFLSLIFGF
tara:strand:+ start:10386 stop:10973 length:588 start_codon:yes stop_codon:yes gene_type:complete